MKIGLSKGSSINIIISSGKDQGIPTEPERNTAGLAAINFLERLDDPPGVLIEIEKGMISCAGLGTSGASAAASVYGLNRLLGSNLSPNELIDMASRAEVITGGEPHADNAAAALLGGFIFVRGYDPMDVVKIEIPEIPIVVAVIKKAQATTRGLIKKEYSLDEVKEQMSYCSSLIHSVLARDLEAIGRFINRDLISEPARARSIPGYEDVKRKVLDAGAYGCNISGGGSSIFAICGEERVHDIAQVLKRELKHLVVEVIITRASNKGLRVVAQCKIKEA